MSKKNKAYGLGVYAFGMAAVGQMAPTLLGDAPLSTWQFAGLTATVCVTFFCAYKSFGAKSETAEVPS